MLYNKKSSNSKKIVFACLIASMSVVYAHANTSFPEFSISNNEVETTNTITEPTSINIQRPLTKDIILLQEQINIIQALIERQSEIQKISKSYETVGINFNQPLPDRSTCKKIPANILCLYSYPDLEKNKIFFSDAETRMKSIQNETFLQAIESVSQETQEKNKRSSAPELNKSLLERLSASDGETILTNENQNDINTQILAEDQMFFWSDIQCIQKKCSALIVSENDNSDRIRVAIGDSLNNDAKVIEITPTKVVVKKDDERTTINPLAIDGREQPIRKKETASRAQISNQQSILQNTSNTNSQELLGPTGLF